MQQLDAYTGKLPELLSPIQTALDQIRRSEASLTNSERLAVEQVLEDIVEFLNHKTNKHSS